MVRMANDKVTSTEIVPLPPPTTKSGVEPIVIDGSAAAAMFASHRISGSDKVVPDEATKRHTWTTLHGAYRVCVDEAGAVESLLALRSTAYPAYDRRLVANLRTWKFSPFVVDDHPVPVCSYVDFRYDRPK
jgi:hypothetical protein